MAVGKQIWNGPFLIFPIVSCCRSVTTVTLDIKYGFWENQNVIFALRFDLPETECRWLYYSKVPKHWTSFFLHSALYCLAKLVRRTHQTSTNLIGRFPWLLSSLPNQQRYAKLSLLPWWNKPGSSKISLKTPMVPQTLQNIAHPYSLHLGKAK